jgi:hypothetical protein
MRGGVGAVYVPDTNSPVLNVVNNAPYSFCSGLDQRRIRRGLGATKCDIGAVERSSALLVVNNSTGATTAEIAWDSYIKTTLESMGFTVTVKDDDVAVTSDASNKHLVFISESVASATVGTKFRDVTNAVIVNEPSLYPSMRMTNSVENTDFGDATNQTTIDLQIPELGNLMGAMGQSALAYTCFAAGTPMGWGVPGSTADKIATISGNSSRAAIFEYMPGDSMPGSTTFNAPGYRAGFFGQPGSTFNDGNILFMNFIVVASGI